MDLSSKIRQDSCHQMCLFSHFQTQNLHVSLVVLCLADVCVLVTPWGVFQGVSGCERWYVHCVDIQVAPKSRQLNGNGSNWPQ